MCARTEAKQQSKGSFSGSENLFCSSFIANSWRADTIKFVFVSHWVGCCSNWLRFYSLVRAFDCFAINFLFVPLYFVVFSNRHRVCVWHSSQVTSRKLRVWCHFCEYYSRSQFAPCANSVRPNSMEWRNSNLFAANERWVRRRRRYKMTAMSHHFYLDDVLIFVCFFSGPKIIFDEQKEKKHRECDFDWRRWSHAEVRMRVSVKCSLFRSRIKSILHESSSPFNCFLAHSKYASLEWNKKFRNCKYITAHALLATIRLPLRTHTHWFRNCIRNCIRIRCAAV